MGLPSVSGGPSKYDRTASFAPNVQVALTSGGVQGSVGHSNQTVGAYQRERPGTRSSAGHEGLPGSAGRSPVDWVQSNGFMDWGLTPAHPSVPRR